MQCPSFFSFKILVSSICFTFHTFQWAPARILDLGWMVRAWPAVLKIAHVVQAANSSGVLQETRWEGYKNKRQVTSSSDQGWQIELCSKGLLQWGCRCQIYLFFNFISYNNLQEILLIGQVKNKTGKRPNITDDTNWRLGMGCSPVCCLTILPLRRKISYQKVLSN